MLSLIIRASMIFEKVFLGHFILISRSNNIPKLVIFTVRTIIFICQCVSPSITVFSPKNIPCSNFYYGPA